MVCQKFAIPSQWLRPHFWLAAQSKQSVVVLMEQRVQANVLISPKVADTGCARQSVEAFARSKRYTHGATTECLQIGALQLRFAQVGGTSIWNPIAGRFTEL